MTDVHLEWVNATYMRVQTDAGILMELSDHLTFFKHNYRFDPKYKARVWDGKIRLLNRLTAQCYTGLAYRVMKFCQQRGYTFSFDDEFAYDTILMNEVEAHIAKYKPEWMDDRDYQADAILRCLRARRMTLLSPTSSGKSFMIYLLMMWYKKKTIIIVPTTGLVQQFKSDLESYGFKGVIDTSMGGLLKDNNIPADVVITTWQSLDNGKKKMPKVWFDQFDVVFGDEAHGAKATTLIKIFQAMDNVRYRFGTTGTLPDNQLDKATIEGLFGKQYRSTTTRELIDGGHAADIKIKCLVFRYPETVRKAFHQPIQDPKDKKKRRRRNYAEETQFLVDYEARTKYIRNLALSLKGNKLIFFRLVEHGKLIYEALKDQPNVFYIDGSVKDRESIRKAIEEEENAILIASLGTTSTGVSINRLHRCRLS